MNILTFDTETISVDKPFCYNIGWIIRSTENWEVLCKKDYVVKQFWENKPLFETAYYAKKKDLYIRALRGKRAIIKYYGFIMQDLIKDIEKYEVEYSYAYNSPFDSRVLDFNCDWFKCSNPLDYMKLIDIRALINPIVFSEEYKKFCMDNNLLTDNGNLQANAESLTRFVRQNLDFQEEHTALSDSIIESDILKYLVEKEINITEPKKVYNVIKSDMEQHLIIDHKGTTYDFEYSSKRNSKGVLYLK